VTDRRWDVAGGVAGVLFSVLVVAGLLMVRLPGGDDRNEDVAQHFADGANRAFGYVAAFLLALAGLAFLGFIAGIWERLRRAEAAPPGGLHLFAFGAGLLFVAMLFLTGAGVSAVAANVQQGGEADYGADVARIAWVGTLALVIFGGFAASAFVAATSALMLRSGAVPRWLALTGFAVAAVLLASVIFLPMIALPLWVVATSAVLLVDVDRRAVARNTPRHTTG
jgi:hypothetical protein